MLNFTEKYIQMTQDNIIYGKNKMDDMHSILLVAQDDKKFANCGLWFTTLDPHEKAIQLAVALIALRISIDPKYSRIKKELFLKRFLNGADFISPIGINKIEKPNLIVFGADAWSSKHSGDPEENKLQPHERKDKKDMIVVLAFERGRPNCAISCFSNIEKKNGQWIITETSKEQNTDEEKGSIPALLSHSFELVDKEDPIAELSVFMAREKLLQAGIAAPSLN